jgi:MoaA/NifB/PqqE/SkfB family radical SAM enzyme/SAM-dependent methyltransferase
MKALIKVGYACNENCSFCHTLEVRHIDGSATEVHRKIERAKALGHTMVVLSGGEATIRPELFEWAAHVARLDLDLGLVTNGLLLAYPEAVERLLKLRLKYVYMSLHGGTAKIHNLLVRAQTFDQATQALANLSGRGLDFTVNCVVTRQNVDHLRSMVDLVLPYPDLTLKFSMVQPKGGGDLLFRSLTPSITDVAAKVHDALSYGFAQTRGRSGPHFTHDGFPFCHLPGFEHLYDDLKTDRYWTMVEIGENDFFPVDDKNKVHPPACHACALRGACPGLFQGYRDAFGEGELRPVHDRARSNSFNYVYEGLVTDRAGDTCHLLADGVTPWDRGRHLFVKNGPRVARFRTETRDFADLELEEIKHDRGQVYLDVSRKPAPDDFARDLVQLARSPLCTPCPERERCTGLFEPVFEDVFSRDDAHVRELLATLEGDVLDLGCGEGPYEEILAPRARSGLLRYTGVDPDGARIAALRQRWPWAHALEVSTGEALLEGPAARFDHALVLRSWNHLRDPARALAGLRRALRPGGTLLVVDNVAFGLARTRAQTSRGESSPAAFEHYRNDGAPEALPLLTAAGFELLDRRDVGPGTSNQWLLRARLPAAPASSPA